MYEVEQKYPVSDLAEFEARLAAMGAVWCGAVEQIDRYFNHPSRDFGATDEALRLRRTGEGVAITWKGPRLDATAKTRREIELPLTQAAGLAAAEGAAVQGERRGQSPMSPSITLEHWTELLEALGFRRVREVAKRRRSATVPRDGRQIEVALDRIAGLGDFVELEIRAASAGEIASAAGVVESLARELGCPRPERRSYLEMLLESDAAR